MARVPAFIVFVWFVCRHIGVFGYADNGTFTLIKLCKFRVSEIQIMPCIFMSIVFQYPEQVLSFSTSCSKALTKKLCECIHFTRENLSRTGSIIKKRGPWTTHFVTFTCRTCLLVSWVCYKCRSLKCVVSFHKTLRRMS